MNAPWGGLASWAAAAAPISGWAILTRSPVYFARSPDVCFESAKAPGDVIFGFALLWPREDLRGFAFFNDTPCKEKDGAVRDPPCLLHIVCHDDNRIVALEGCHELFDLQRGDRVQRRGWLVHQQNLRLGGEGPPDAEALLLAARKARCQGLEPVFHLILDCRLMQAAPDQVAAPVGGFHFFDFSRRPLPHGGLVPGLYFV